MSKQKTISIIIAVAIVVGGASIAYSETHKNDMKNTTSSKSASAITGEKVISNKSNQIDINNKKEKSDIKQSQDINQSKGSSHTDLQSKKVVTNTDVQSGQTSSNIVYVPFEPSEVNININPQMIEPATNKLSNDGVMSNARNSFSNASMPVKVENYPDTKVRKGVSTQNINSNGMVNKDVISNNEKIAKVSSNGENEINKNLKNKKETTKSEVKKIESKEVSSESTIKSIENKKQVTEAIKKAESSKKVDKPDIKVTDSKKETTKPEVKKTYGKKENTKPVVKDTSNKKETTEPKKDNKKDIINPTSKKQDNKKSDGLEIPKRTKGWLKKDGKTYFIENDNKPAIGWLSNEGHKYYFNKQGVMQTGFIFPKGESNYYYCNDKGQLVIGSFTSGGDEYGTTLTGVINSVIIPSRWCPTNPDYGPIQNMEYYYWLLGGKINGRPMEILLQQYHSYSILLQGDNSVQTKMRYDDNLNKLYNMTIQSKGDNLIFTVYNENGSVQTEFETGTYFISNSAWQDPYVYGDQIVPYQQSVYNSINNPKETFVYGSNNPPTGIDLGQSGTFYVGTLGNGQKIFLSANPYVTKYGVSSSYPPDISAVLSTDPTKTLGGIYTQAWPQIYYPGTGKDVVYLMDGSKKVGKLEFDSMAMTGTYTDYKTNKTTKCALYPSPDQNVNFNLNQL